MPILTPPQTFLLQRWTSGAWYSASSGSATGTLGVGTARVAPIYVPNRCTLSAIAAEVTSAGSAGSVFRLGIWNDSNGFPTTVLLDAGTIDGTSVTIQSITISLTIAPGLYWIGGVSQGAPATDPTMRILGGTGVSAGQIGIVSASPMAQGIFGYQNASMTGALATWSGTMANNAGSAPRVCVRVA